MTPRQERWLFGAGILAGLLAVALGGWSADRPVPCTTSGPAWRGDARLGADGRPLWFDGRCWIATPILKDMPNLPPFRALPVPPPRP